MKFFAILLVTFCVVFGASAQNARQSFAEGQRAFMAGDMSKAREKFDAVLAVEPAHKESLRYIGMIAAREKSGDPAAAQQKKLAAIVFPVINFKEADLPSVLEFLKQEGEKLSPHGAQINFVMRLPEGAADKAITLSLRNIPFMEALRYIGQIADVAFAVEQYAIVVTPTEKTSAAEASEPAE